MTVAKNNRAFTLNHLKLIVRLIFFVSAIIVYVATGGIINNKIFSIIIWAVFAIEMIMKLFPLKWESLGSQKLFKRHFISAKEKVHAKIEKRKKVLLIALLWVLLNGIIAHLYFKEVIDIGIMIIISLFYSVCDMICVLFYCPFQRIMGNKCCNTCSIHNWDYAMMFTPLVFVDNAFAKSLFLLGFIIFIIWEYTVFRHPERFCESTNMKLSCQKCTERRCSRKGMKRI